MKLKSFKHFLTEANKVNPIKSSLGNFLATNFNEPRTLTDQEFIDLFYEGVFSFIKEYLSDHDLEEITKKEIDKVVADNIKRKIPSYVPKSYGTIDYLDQIKDEKLLAIPNLIYNHYVFYHYKDYFIFNVADRTAVWKDEQIEHHVILNLFGSLEDLGIDFEFIQDINFIFKLKKENKLSSDFFNISPKNPFSKLTLRTLDFSNKQLKKLPLNLPNLLETFNCSNNELITLRGAPKEVGRNFDCYRNQLTSLEGGPKEVGRDFDCSNNKLTSLRGGPKEVGRDFDCYKNKLTSLEGAPKTVGGDFDCSRNQLITLEGSPKEVGRNFDCFENKLTSLEGAPKTVGEDFNCCKNLLTSLEGAPKEVGGDFYCHGHPKKFTEEEVRAICKVGGKVIV